MLTREEAIKQMEELKKYIEGLDKSIGFKDDEIFLLSIEEYERYKDKIPYVKCYWWLRSPGCHDNYATYVDYDGYVSHNGDNVYDYSRAVRPAVKYDKVGYYRLDIVKNRVIINDFPFRIIDKENKIAIAEVPIAFDKFDEKSNDYENTYIRNWLLDWLVSENK